MARQRDELIDVHLEPVRPGQRVAGGVRSHLTGRRLRSREAVDGLEGPEVGKVVPTVGGIDGHLPVCWDANAQDRNIHGLSLPSTGACHAATNSEARSPHHSTINRSARGPSVPSLGAPASPKNPEVRGTTPPDHSIRLPRARGSEIAGVRRLAALAQCPTAPRAEPWRAIGDGSWANRGPRRGDLGVVVGFTLSDRTEVGLVLTPVPPDRKRPPHPAARRDGMLPEP